MIPQDRFSQLNACPLCEQDAVCYPDTTQLLHDVPDSPNNVKCERCGEFLIRFNAFQRLEDIKQHTLISGITREWFELGIRAEVNQDNLTSLLNLAPKTFKEKRQKLIQALARKIGGYNEEHNLNLDIDYPLAYVKNQSEFTFVLSNLHDENLATRGTNQGSILGIRLTARGWMEADSFQKPVSLRDKAFVAMWFEDSIKTAYNEALEPAIVAAGYRAIRIDLEEHSDIIIDRIIAEIKEARFVVADFSGHRGGVYFEAGFARGLGLDVIWTCRSTDFVNLHFDVKAFNVIVWNTHEELLERLQARIRAIVGNGPYSTQKAVRS